MPFFITPAYVDSLWLINSAVLAVHNLMIARFGGTDGIRDEGLSGHQWIDLDRGRSVGHRDDIVACRVRDRRA